MLRFELQTVLRETKGRWLDAGQPPRLLATGISTDSRSLAPGDLFFALEGDRDGHVFVRQAIEKGATACVVRKERSGLSSGPLIAVDDPLEALENVALWHRRSLSAGVTAITGSMGKTTTKEFLRALLAVRYRVVAAPKSFNNRLGVALTLFAADRATEQLVLEMGTSGSGEIAHLSKLVKPDRAMITMIAPAHLSGLKDLDGVIAAKAEILDGLTRDGVFYANADLPRIDEVVRRAPGLVRTYGWGKGDFAIRRCSQDALGTAAGAGLPRRSTYVFEVQGEELRLPVFGRHNVLNATAAVAVARDLGLSWEEIREGLGACRAPPQRMQIADEGSVLFLDDSYNANPGSMASAIDAWEELPVDDGQRVAILGDMLELGKESRRFHESVGRRLASVRIDLLVTVGSDSRFLADAFDEEARQRATLPSPETCHFEDVGEAGHFLKNRLRPGDQVLVKGSNLSGVNCLAGDLRRWARGAMGAAGARGTAG